MSSKLSKCVSVRNFEKSKLAMRRLEIPKSPKFARAGSIRNLELPKGAPVLTRVASIRNVELPPSIRNLEKVSSVRAFLGQMISPKYADRPLELPPMVWAEVVMSIGF